MPLFLAQYAPGMLRSTAITDPSAFRRGTFYLVAPLKDVGPLPINQKFDKPKRFMIKVLRPGLSLSGELHCSPARDGSHSRPGEKEPAFYDLNFSNVSPWTVSCSDVINPARDRLLNIVLMPDASLQEAGLLALLAGCKERCSFPGPGSRASTAECRLISRSEMKEANGAR